jgi:CRISPR-associated endonuclease/helicase Cas3
VEKPTASDRHTRPAVTQALDIGAGDWAHAPPGDTPRTDGHALNDHLRAVGRLAEALAPCGLGQLARLAGLWHDVGKRRDGFQRFIRQAGGADAHIEGRVADRDKTHSAAGALWAERYLADKLGAQGRVISRLLQYVIAGHHAGLSDWEGGLADRLAGADALEETKQALARPNPDDILHPELGALDARSLLALMNERADGTAQPGRAALHLRMLFSALVDADFLDTEAYFQPDMAGHRVATAEIKDLLRTCESHLEHLSAGAHGAVNRVRADVLRQCRTKAELPPGVFRLTVPTGGGKTLSSLAFALTHAARHGKRRVVYAIPYTSIIEQTADVFRNVFASLGDDVVVEHHSNAESDESRENHRSRLACENWDAPLVVTTNVQLFESLFARRTSRCRKLHSLVDSIIVLDEAQLLPLEFLQPVVDVLRYLVQDFGATVLLCTATQPVLDAAAGFDPQRGLQRGIGPVTEIIDDVPALYAALERVQVRLPQSLNEPRTWLELADEIAGHDAVLAIVSRRTDAAELFRLVKAHSGAAGGCWHLSALMCPQHRSDTLGRIKAALADRREALAAGREAAPVRVISTQLVEAGVDLDFPVVYRALAGLDSVAQAAGRCNREGRLDVGHVHVFVPPTKAPPGLLTLARDTCRAVWHDLPAQPFALPLVEQYFRRLLYDAKSTDEKRICEMLSLRPDMRALTLPLRLKSAAEAFKLIEDDGATVLVRYRSAAARDDIEALIGMLERDGPSRWSMRKLQRYGVTIHRRQTFQLLRDGMIREVSACPGLYVQHEACPGLYDGELGLRADSAPGDRILVV